MKLTFRLVDSVRQITLHSVSGPILSTERLNTTKTNRLTTKNKICRLPLDSKCNSLLGLQRAGLPYILVSPNLNNHLSQFLKINPSYHPTHVYAFTCSRSFIYMCVYFYLHILLVLFVQKTLIQYAYNFFQTI